MSTDSRVRNYWREELALVAVLLVLFGGVLVFSLRLPFDAKLFPLIVGTAGIVLGLIIAVQALRQRRSVAGDLVAREDDTANVSWPRFATALLSAPVFGVVFWLFGFFIASLAAMLVMPPLMQYSDRRTMVLVGLATVAFLAVFFPYLVGVSLPHGVVGDWLLDQLRAH